MEPVKIYLTFEINADEPVFDFLGDIKKLNMGSLLTKYDFSILLHTEQQKLEFIVKEIRDQKEDLLLGYAFKLPEELVYIKKRLNEENILIQGIFIPSPARIKQTEAEAMKNAKLHGRWIGTSEQETEKVYLAYKNMINEIKSFSLDNGIAAMEC